MISMMSKFSIPSFVTKFNRKVREMTIKNFNSQKVHVYQIFISFTFELNFLMKFGRYDLLFMKIISINFIKIFNYISISSEKKKVRSFKKESCLQRFYNISTYIWEKNMLRTIRIRFDPLIRIEFSSFKISFNVFNNENLVFEGLSVAKQA